MTKEQRLSLLKARGAALQPSEPSEPSKPQRAPRGPRQRVKGPRRQLTPEERKQHSERITALHKARRAAGLCAKCEEPSPDTWACVVCRAKHSEAKRERRARRIAAGLCPMCGRPAAPGGTLCEPHRAGMRERARVERGYQRPYGPRKPRDTK